MELHQVQDLNVNIGKILLYARQNNTIKFLKYLRFLRPPKEVSEGDPAKFLPLEIILRKKGALEAITMTLRTVTASNYFNMTWDSELKDDGNIDVEVKNSKRKVQDQNEIRISIIQEGLRIMGNAFFVDVEARREAFKHDFVALLHRLMEHPNLIFNDNIQTRTLKCIRNFCLSNSKSPTHEEISCRRQILRSGIVTSIFRVIGYVKKSVESETQLSKIKSKTSNGTENKDINIDTATAAAISEEKLGLLLASARVIRVLAEDPETQTYLCRLDALVIVGDILVWGQLKLTDEIISSIFRALTVLSERLRTAMHKVVFQVRTDGEPFLKEMVRLFRTSESEKFTSQIITCLTNFAKNKDLVSIFRHEQIFNTVFSRIETTSENSLLEQLVKLLRELVSQDSVIHSYLLPHSSQVGSTLKILRSKAFADYHYFILNFYENLFWSSIPVLTSLDLMDLLMELLREFYKECTYGNLRSLICTVDGDVCPSHSQGCTFLPVYRCMSPSYLQAQKDVKEYMETRTNLINDAPEFNQRNSWSSGNVSDEDKSGGGFSPCTASGNYSPVSSNAGSDDDEGVGGESNVFPDVLFEFSDGEDVTTDVDSDSSLHKRFKRRKMNSHPPSHFNNGTLTESDDSRVGFGDKQTYIKKIASIIGILKKLMHIEPFKPELLRFVPTLLSLLCDGKVSCMNYESSVDSSSIKDETNSVISRCFYGAYTILREFFAKILNFQSLLESHVIPIIYRLIILGKENESANDELKKCNTLLEKLLPILAGEEFEEHKEKVKTTGWREGVLMKSLLSTTNPCLKQQAGLAIPLLFTTDSYFLRECEFKGGAWSALLSTLGRVDEIPNYLFQDSIISLAALCKTFGMKWTEGDEYSKKKQLISHNSEDFEIVDNDSSQTLRVLFELDNGECFSFEKDCLTTASPVFEAMFDGHFLEADEQRVKLPNTSRKALQALVYQISSRNTQTTIGQVDPTYDLHTVFELFSLSNRFLLNDIHEMTSNSIIASYLCPYSAPGIYQQAVQMSPFETPDDAKWTGLFDFPKLVLKYLLVGSGISCGLKCSSFKKIFDSVEPFIVIRDLKCIFEHYAKSKVTVAPTPRRMLNSVNIMLKS